VVDGVLYTTGSWSLVFAIDARTGKQIWKWDPKVPREYGQKACCDVVNRGVALYKGRVYVATLDGRLAALDAATGEPVWEVVTVDQTKPYTITAAPRIAAGKVIIGNGGAEFGVRGYVSAYDAETGRLVWRTYTVPGDPDKPFESKALQQAARTWKKSSEWLKIGAGGTVWDSMAYDPELGFVYVGTGNGVAWDRHVRSPGGGDNLYLASILALDVETGEIRWHYQTTPSDSWDFDSCQHLILTDLDVKGKTRSVLMQAPKNGFFYVLDRANGKLLSAEKYAEVTWARGVDLKTGRPAEVRGQDYTKGVAIVKPTAAGAHNWQPMSYNPTTGLVYIPAQDITGAYEKDSDFKFAPGEFNTALNLAQFKGLTRKISSGHLLAWDPRRQKEAWRVPYKTPWNGGTLTTAGNLVFQGTADGRFVAYRATDGDKLWEAPAGTGVIAAPITYMVDGMQYVTIMAGWGGAFALYGGDAAAAAGVKNAGKILTFALERKPEAKVARIATPPTEDVSRGETLYHKWCARCHGATAIGGGVIRDLRHSTEDVQKIFVQIVRGGIPGTGMPAWAKYLSDGEIRQIESYIRAQAAEESAVR
jgi:quinohemoprotein ethanol dehydrogenase